MRISLYLLPGLLALRAACAFGQDAVLSADVRMVPGETPTPRLTYQDSAAKEVAIAGTWDRWADRYPMQKQGDVWVLDVRPLALDFGRHEYKFVLDDVWEPGDNRIFYINENHLLERPPDVIASATIDDWDYIRVFFKERIPDPSRLRIRLEPDVPLKGWRVASAGDLGFREGYAVSAGTVRFVFDEATHGKELAADARVAVAGNFNGWDGSGGGRWLLRKSAASGNWELPVPLLALRPAPGEKDLLFKFVVNGNEWVSPPPGAANALSDGKGNVNFHLRPGGGGSTAIEIRTVEPLDLSRNYVLVVDGVAEKTVRRMLTPDQVFNRMYSEKPLGAILDRENNVTTYRLFAPRALSVHLNLYDGPEYQVEKPVYKVVEPVERYPLWKDPEDGVWEVSLLGLDVGRYYSFNVDGSPGDGEGFNAEAAVGDPYARAAAHARNNAIVVDPEATNRWFAGWTDQDYVQPEPQDVLIYEAHVRDLTIHPSSGVDPQLRGDFAGIIASEGTGTGLDHLRELGVNMLELLPVPEFENGVDEHNWGYATTFFFAPEASYGHSPLTGSQYYEFKTLVNELHRRGIGVILDVVYNHVGSPNVFSLIDKKYFFRLNPDYSFSNFSGVGNDVRTESPMMRRLIVDNIVYWMREHHVDGFRFDLAELIDMDTMMAIRDAARAINPKVLLISEPWSFRGENKHLLTGTGWSAWNNDFRYAVKDFAAGKGDREGLRKCIFGSVETWAADPLQPVNYVESHDDMALADELSTAPGQDGSRLIPTDLKVNRLAATILFTSLGLPMVAEGQEFVRSKRGIHNSYNKGDAINALNWEDRERPGAAETLAYYHGLMRLRMGPKGAAFRVAKRPPANYYRWIRPNNRHALGYVVNAPHRHEGAGFVVLLNASADPVDFSVPIPEGRWRMISNGTTLNPDGLPNAGVIQGPHQASIRVPGIRSVILMDGF